MNNRKSVIVFFIAIMVFGSAAVARAQTISLTGVIGKGKVNRGGTTRATVTMNIPGGLHVNSNRPGSKFAIPTTVRLTVTGGKAGSVTYPRGRSRTFSFSDGAINVYEERTSLAFDVKVPANFAGNTLRVSVLPGLHQGVVYPPTSKTLNLTADVL